MLCSVAPLIAQQPSVNAVPMVEERVMDHPSHLSLTLDEAIALGLRQSPVVLGKDVEAVEKMYAERQAQSSLYPQVSLNGSYSYTLKKQRIYFDGMPGMGSMPGADEGIEMGRTHNIQAGLQASMPLVNAALWKNLSLNRKQVEMALMQSDISRQDLVAQIKQAFYASLLARESYLTLSQSLKNAELNQQSIQQKYEAGLVAEYDKMRAEVQYANLKPNVLQAEQAMQLSLMQLAVLLGLEPTTDLQVEGELLDYQQQSMAILATVQPADTTWQTTNPTLLLLAKQQEMIDESVTLSKLSWVPTLSLGANYNYNFSSNELNLDNKKLWVPFSAISLQLQIPIFTGFRNYYSTRQAKAKALLFELQRNDTRRNLALGMEQQLNQAASAQEQYKVATQVQQTAQRGYTIAQKRYDTGMATLLEVNDAEVSWLQARLNEKQALYNYLLASVQIEKLLGTPVEEDEAARSERLKSIKKLTQY